MESATISIGEALIEVLAKALNPWILELLIFFS